MLKVDHSTHRQNLQVYISGLFRAAGQSIHAQSQPPSLVLSPKLEHVETEDWEEQALSAVAKLQQARELVGDHWRDMAAPRDCSLPPSSPPADDSPTASPICAPQSTSFNSNPFAPAISAPQATPLRVFQTQNTHGSTSDYAGRVGIDFASPWDDFVSPHSRSDWGPLQIPGMGLPRPLMPDSTPTPAQINLTQQMTALAATPTPAAAASTPPIFTAGYYPPSAT
ncbi:hypothetical protein C8J57DRAFT_1236171 [Mycena rebaudengoi]|nr:hypothetical protein C8J57DRAFT_1236171 [Mycena rebaudengoi]